MLSILTESAPGAALNGDASAPAATPAGPNESVVNETSLQGSVRKDSRPMPASANESTVTGVTEDAGTKEKIAETEAESEFEIVLGRRQVASVLFVATVIGAVLCAGSYLAGKSFSPKKADVVPAGAAGSNSAAGAAGPNSAAGAAGPNSAAGAAGPNSAAGAAGSNSAAGAANIPLIEATVEPDIAAAEAKAKEQLKASARSKPILTQDGNGPVTGDPLFADPTPGATYIQMAAVDKGVATVFVEGLRARGFRSFVAPGPSETMFRVLIGPMTDPPMYARTKQALTDIGLATFGRKYDK